jgi:hypothetical protein
VVTVAVAPLAAPVTVSVAVKVVPVNPLMESIVDDVKLTVCETVDVIVTPRSIPSIVEFEKVGSSIKLVTVITLNLEISIIGVNDSAVVDITHCIDNDFAFVGKIASSFTELATIRGVDEFVEIPKVNGL